MHFFIYYIIFFLLNPQFYTNIEHKNQYIESFNKQMTLQDFRGAINTFEKLEDVHRIIDTRIRLDAAHAYFILGDSAKARVNYEISQDVNDIQVASASRNQLGVLALSRKDSSTAIRYFKSAIEKNNQLSEARFNYELISKLYHPPTQNSHVNDQIDAEIISSEEKERELKSFVSESISLERAIQLLDNLREFERKGITTKVNSTQKVEKDW